MPQTSSSAFFVSTPGFETLPPSPFERWLAKEFDTHQAVGHTATVPREYLRLPCGCSSGVVYKPNQEPDHQKQFHVHRDRHGNLIHTECSQKLSAH